MTSVSDYIKENFSGIDELRIYNNYGNLHHFKIRLKGASDPNAFTFSSGTMQSFEVRGITSECNIYYQGHPVQQLDLNDGGSSDDMNMPNTDSKYNDKNTITYRASKHDVKTLIDFDDATCASLYDDDGIDGGKSAKFTAKVMEDEVFHKKHLAIIIE